LSRCNVFPLHNTTFSLLSYIVCILGSRKDLGVSRCYRGDNVSTGALLLRKTHLTVFCLPTPTSGSTEKGPTYWYYDTGTKISFPCLSLPAKPRFCPRIQLVLTRLAAASSGRRDHCFLPLYLCDWANNCPCYSKCRGSSWPFEMSQLQYVAGPGTPLASNSATPIA
jgi:hypothetical protein